MVLQYTFKVFCSFKLSGLKIEVLKDLNFLTMKDCSKIEIYSLVVEMNKLPTYPYTQFF